MSEKDKLLRELDTCRQHLNITKDKVFDVSDNNFESQIRKSEEVKVSEVINTPHRPSMVGSFVLKITKGLFTSWIELCHRFGMT